MNTEVAHSLYGIKPEIVKTKDYTLYKFCNEIDQSYKHDQIYSLILFVRDNRISFGYETFKWVAGRKIKGKFTKIKKFFRKSSSDRYCISFKRPKTIGYKLFRMTRSPKWKIFTNNKDKDYLIKFIERQLDYIFLRIPRLFGNQESITNIKKKYIREFTKNIITKEFKKHNRLHELKNFI